MGKQTCARAHRALPGPSPVSASRGREDAVGGRSGEPGQLLTLEARRAGSKTGPRWEPRALGSRPSCTPRPALLNRISPLFTNISFSKAGAAVALLS